MLEKLELDKVMYFAPEPLRAITFRASLQELAASLGMETDGIEDSALTQGLEAIINEGLHAAAHAIGLGTYEPHNDNILPTLRTWATGIHNDTLTKARADTPGFPANLVYEILTLARGETGTTAALWKQFLDGINALKICQGNAPGEDFLATTSYVQTLAELQKDNVPLSASDQAMLALSPILEYEGARGMLQLTLTRTIPMKHTIYSALNAQNTFRFPRVLNPGTGAHCYHCSDALKSCTQALVDAEYDEVQQLGQALSDCLQGFARAYEEVHAGKTEFVRLCAHRDASEYVARAMVMLQAIEGKYDGLDYFSRLSDQTVVGDIWSRGLTGEFPEHTRIQMIQGVRASGVAQLFFQDSIAHPMQTMTTASSSSSSGSSSSSTSFGTSQHSFMPPANPGVADTPTTESASTPPSDQDRQTWGCAIL